MLEQLQNGAYIIAERKKYYEHDKHLRVVLCYWNHGDRKEYVTWVRNMQDVERGYDGTYHGHYFDNILDASEDFTGRT